MISSTAISVKKEMDHPVL
jgi:hypothetical protein